MLINLILITSKNCVYYAGLYFVQVTMNIMNVLFFILFQVYEALEHRLVVAEAAQRLRLPLISKDGEVHEEEIEKLSVLSRSSLDSSTTSVTISSNSSNFTNISAINTGSSTNNVFPTAASDVGDLGVGGVPNRFLGITPGYLWQSQVQRAPLPMVR